MTPRGSSSIKCKATALLESVILLIGKIADSGSRIIFPPNLGFRAFSLRLDDPNLEVNEGANLSEESSREEIIRKIAELTKELIIKDKDGQIDRQRIRNVRLQSSKILRRLEKLEIGLAQENLSEDIRTNIEEEIETEISELLRNIIFD